MAPPLLTLRNIHLSFGGTALLEGAELSVSNGERLCVVGRNGSGKSTLLKIAAGLVEADSGERFLKPGVSVGYLAQEPDLSGFSTVLEYVEDALIHGDAHARAYYLLGHLGLNGDEDPAHLSGGEARRAALARALAPEHDVLMLDEPTNHLDLPAIEWLESEIKTLRCAVVLISHDRAFLSALSRGTLWVHQGEVRRLGEGFSAFEAWRDEALENIETERHKLKRKIVREMHWLNRGVTARRKRNQGRLRALQDLRQQRKNQRAALGTVQLVASEGPASGKLVADAEHISKAFGETGVVTDLSLRIQRGDRLGLVGPNGAGKTTLIKILTGTLQPDSGSVRLGTRLDMVTLDQKRESLNPEWTLAEALSEGGGDSVFVNGEPKHVVGYMKDFLFVPEQKNTPIKALSGGERGRLMLARAFAKPSNLLVLDEPTNDLDLETLDLLQDRLGDYAGTVLLVSHDRDFLDRVATSILAFEGDGVWREYAGGYSDMIAQRAHGAKNRESGDFKGKKSPTSKRPQVKKKKLSYKDKYALETLPGVMEKLEGEMDKLQAILGEANLFARDAEAFNTALGALEARKNELAAAEEKWLELEVRREEVEGPQVQT